MKRINGSKRAKSDAALLTNRGSAKLTNHGSAKLTNHGSAKLTKQGENYNEGKSLQLLSFFFEEPGQVFVASELHKRMNSEKASMSYSSTWKWLKAFVRVGFVQEEGHGYKLHVDKCKHCYHHYRVILNRLAGL